MMKESGKEEVGRTIAGFQIQVKGNSSKHYKEISQLSGCPCSTNK